MSDRQSAVWPKPRNVECGPTGKKSFELTIRRVDSDDSDEDTGITSSGRMSGQNDDVADDRDKACNRDCWTSGVDFVREETEEKDGKECSSVDAVEMETTRSVTRSDEDSRNETYGTVIN